MEQAELLGTCWVSPEVWISVAQSGPRMDREPASAENWIFQLGSAATFFACGAE